MAKKREKEFLKKCIKYREFTVPVLHLEFLNSKELNTALQIVDTFETAGVPFACVMRNAFRKNELNLHIYGFISSKEKNRIFEEVVEMYAEDKVFNEITLNWGGRNAIQTNRLDWFL